MSKGSLIEKALNEFEQAVGQYQRSFGSSYSVIDKYKAARDAAHSALVDAIRLHSSPERLPASDLVEKLEALHQKPMSSYNYSCGYLDCLNEVKAIVRQHMESKPVGAMRDRIADICNTAIARAWANEKTGHDYADEILALTSQDSQ